MCQICNGMTIDQSRDHLAEKVARYGWAITVVEAPAGGLPWYYTVGLIEHFDHPELVVVGTDLEPAAHLLHGLAAYVESGECLWPGRSYDVGGLDVAVSEVHPAHRRHGAFSSWEANYEWWPQPPELRVLEVVVPAQLLCECHQASYPMLHTARPVVGGPALNRAARRAARRAGRRPGRPKAR